jgi:carboxypeptidase Taq
MNKKTNYDLLLEQVYEIHDLDKVDALMRWDRQVNMPPMGSQSRTDQLLTIGRLRHNTFTSDKMGDLIAAAAEDLNGTSYDSDEASLIRVIQHQYELNRKLPTEFVDRRTQISNKAQQVWEQARKDNDFAAFQPWLEKVIGLCQELADYYGYEEEKYDALLDTYERGAKTADVRAIFEAAKGALIPLREAVSEKVDTIDDGLLYRHYDIDKQKAFAHYIAEAVGYDFQRGHIGTAVHPFATSFSRDDARITVRWYENYLAPSIFGALHESGHAMYEQGTHPNLARTPLARGTSMGLHESQSRTIENVIGRSYGFWQRQFPKLQEMFPEQLGSETVKSFYQAINKVQPNLIRVEADEVTYNLHIILRFELEQAMLNGDLKAADLPGAWNEKMKSLIGIVPPNDSDGCLQDIHWTGASFGYFPTYALGNLYAAQFLEAAVAQDASIGTDLEEGKTAGLINWLKENVHQHGQKFTPNELVVRATGEPLNFEPFTRYIWKKFSAIYDLK